MSNNQNRKGKIDAKRLDELLKRYFTAIEIKEHEPSLPELMHYITNLHQEENQEYETHIKGCERCQRVIKMYRNELRKISKNF
ncbi:MAG: hypothetical protein AABX08_00640 [Nanoarchaeota archaeon]